MRKNTIYTDRQYKGYSLIFTTALLGALLTITFCIFSNLKLTEQDAHSDFKQLELQSLNTKILIEKAKHINPENLLEQLASHPQETWLPIFHSYEKNLALNLHTKKIHHDIGIKNTSSRTWKTGYSLTHSRIFEVLFSAKTHVLDGGQQFGQTIGLRWVSPNFANTSVLSKKHIPPAIASKTRSTASVTGPQIAYNAEVLPYRVRWQCKTQHINSCSTKTVLFTQRRSNIPRQLNHLQDNHNNSLIEMIDVETEQVLWQAQPAYRAINHESNSRLSNVQDHFPRIKKPTLTVIPELTRGYSTAGKPFAEKIFSVDTLGNLWRWDINPIPQSAATFATGGMIAQLSARSPTQTDTSDTIYTAPDLTPLKAGQHSHFLAATFASLHTKQDTSTHRQTTTLNIYIIKDPYTSTAPESYHYVRTPNGTDRSIHLDDLVQLSITPSQSTFSEAIEHQCQSSPTNGKAVWGYRLTTTFITDLADNDSSSLIPRLSNPLIIEHQILIGVHLGSNNTHLITLDTSHWQEPHCIQAHRYRWSEAAPDSFNNESLTWGYIHGKPSPLIDVCFSGQCRSDIVFPNHHLHQNSQNAHRNITFSTPYGLAQLWYWSVNHPPVMPHF